MGNPHARQPASPIGIMSMLLEAVNLVQEGHYGTAKEMAQTIALDLEQILIEEAKEASESRITFD